MMKIMQVHLAGVANFGGSERYCADLSRLLAGAGHEVLVVVREGVGKGQRERGAWWRQSIGNAKIYAVPWWVPKWFLGWVLRRIMLGFEPEIVHCHLGGANKWAGKAAKSLNIQWVTTAHLRWKNKEMRGAAGVICIARWQAVEIDKDYRGLVRVIGNWLPDLGGINRGGLGVDLGQVGVRLRDDLGKVGERFGAGLGQVEERLPNDMMMFGSVGRLHPVKGMDILVRAFQMAFPNLPTDAQVGSGEASIGSLREGENVRLRIVGEGEQRGELERLIGGDTRIELVGQCAEMTAEYARMDVLVSAARYEPFGLAIVEGMAQGLPLVCTRTEGPSEFLAGRDAVVWAEKGDVASLAGALRAAFARGRRRVDWDLSAFDERRALAEVVAFYGEVRGRLGMR